MFSAHAACKSTSSEENSLLLTQCLQQKKPSSVALLERFAVHYLTTANCKLSFGHESKLQATIFSEMH